jgi:hypothetical protein
MIAAKVSFNFQGKQALARPRPDFEDGLMNYLVRSHRLRRRVYQLYSGNHGIL